MAEPAGELLEGESKGEVQTHPQGQKRKSAMGGSVSRLQIQTCSAWFLFLPAGDGRESIHSPVPAPPVKGSPVSQWQRYKWQTRSGAPFGYRERHLPLSVGEALNPVCAGEEKGPWVWITTSWSNLRSCPALCYSSALRQCHAGRHNGHKPPPGWETYLTSGKKQVPWIKGSPNLAGPRRQRLLSWWR